MARGFTLVELAIVLVIVGLLLGAILRGQAMVNNARARRLLGRLLVLATAQQTYLDRRGRYAGDADADGLVEDAEAAWSELAEEHLLNPGADAVHPFSGSCAGRCCDFGSARCAGFGGGADAKAAGANCVLARRVPQWAARMVDRRVDDGQGDAGRVRWSTAGSPCGEPYSGDEGLRGTLYYFFDL